MRIAAIILAAFTLAGCAAVPRPATIYQGECRVFQDPGFRVRGVTTADKRWIATTQEQGIQVCGWKRPPKMPEPAGQVVFACADVLKAVQMFGSVEAAEAYAVSQGATPEQIAAARTCLEPPVVKAPRPGLGSRHRMTRKQQERSIAVPLPPAAPAVVATPVAAAAPAAVVPPPVVAQPVAAKKCKPRKYRWQYWRPKACA